MNSTSLTTAAGKIVEDPSAAVLGRALDALLGSDEPEADLWLENDDGWALSVVPSGDIFFENLNDSSSYLTLGPLEKAELLRLLQLLAAGSIKELRAEPWEAGE